MVAHLCNPWVVFAQSFDILVVRGCLQKEERGENQVLPTRCVYLYLPSTHVYHVDR
jgi:hypothetical protein